MIRTGIASALFALAGLGALVRAPPAIAQEPSPLPVCRAGPGVMLEGVVVDRATRVPLGEAEVTAETGGETRRARTTADGHFRFCGIPASATIRLRASSSGLSSGVLALESEETRGPVLVDIDLGPPSPVRVAVSNDETGEPVEGVTIRLQPGIIGGVTNRNGVTGLGRVPPGVYRLRGDHIAFEPFEARILVGPGEQRRVQIALTPRAIAVDPLNVTIRSGACAPRGYTSVSGRVVDRSTGLPLAGARVSGSRYEEDEGFVGDRAIAGDDGLFILCGMPEEARVRLQAELRGRTSDPRYIEARRSGEAIVLEIDHGEPGFVALRVVDHETGAPVEGAAVRLRPLPLGGFTNERGRLGIREVPPGEYEVRVDHIAYASFEGTMTVGDRAADEWEIPLSPTAIAMEPLEVKVTGRDPYLIGLGFYDRMMDENIEGRFFDYWDFESYGTLGTFTDFKTFVRADRVLTFVNGRPFDRTGYLSLGEIPFGKVRGVEFIRCADLPQAMARWIDDFALIEAADEKGYHPCLAELIWRGERRVRSEREPPTGRCARERRAELECESGGSPDDDGGPAAPDAGAARGGASKPLFSSSWSAEGDEVAGGRHGAPFEESPGSAGHGAG